MRLTTRGQAALTAIADIATHQGIDPVSLREVSARQNISVSYLEQLVGKMRCRGLVKSVRGNRGGYRLSRSVELITIAEIVLCVDNSIYATQRGCRKNGHGLEKFLIQNLWSSVNRIALDYLATLTLKQVIQDQAFRQGRAPSLRNTSNGMPAPGSLRLGVKTGLPAPRAAAARRLGAAGLQRGFALADSTIALAAFGILAAHVLLAY